MINYRINNYYVPRIMDYMIPTSVNTLYKTKDPWSTIIQEQIKDLDYKKEEEKEPWKQ
jgi:hypothetical protein